MNRADDQALLADKAVARRLAEESGLAEFDATRCRALMRVLTSIVWVTDASGRFQRPQPTWQAYTGQEWDAQQEWGWVEAVHPDDRQHLRDQLKVAREQRCFFRASGRLWHAASSTWRFFEARGVPILDEAGEILEWVGTCKDVEDRKRAEASMHEADRRKDEFIAILAHELRNPLAPIRNAAHVLKRRGNDDMQLSWARSIIERQVSLMSHLLDDLLDVSRISQNKIQLDKSRVTLDSILDAALEVSRPLLEQQGHLFELNVLAGPIYVEADSGRLAQAFANLLNNAAKYTNPGGRVSLTVRQDGDQAVVTVQDNGIGIAPEMQSRVFQMFSQVEPALERSQGGLGIGLSLVKSLVEMHGGTVEVRSEGVGKGSEFTVRIPAATRRLAPSPPRAPEPRAPRPLRILVADDNRDAAETLSVLLEMMGHDVHVAADGEEAVQIARSFRPSVALLDIGMPKLDGYEAAEQIRVLLPQVLLVATTGWGQRDDMRRAAQAGFDHHLVKPVDPDQLLGLLARVEPELAGV